MLEYQQIPLDAITPSPFQLRQWFDPVALQSLAYSLAEVGLIQAITVRPKGDGYELVYGERRWRAMQLVPGATTILALIRDVTDIQARRLLASENIQRANLSALEGIEAIAALVDADLLDEATYAALGAMVAPDLTTYTALGDTALQRVRQLLVKLDSDRRRGTDHVSHKFVGQVERLFARLPKPVEWRSYFEHDLPLLKLPEPVKALINAETLNKSQAEALGELYAQVPQTFARLVADGGARAWDDLADWRASRDEIRPLSELSAREIRLILSHETLRQAKSTPAPVVAPDFPNGTYRCLVIDPPWPMDKSERITRPTQGDHLGYPVMSLEAILALPIADLAHPEGCHVYLWVTQRFLFEGFRCFEAWGVHYHCLLTWVKPTGMTPFSWMFNTEHVLFGWIGHLPLLKLGQKVAFEAPVTEHSEKPEVFYDVVRAVSPAPRLDLFARAAHDDFERWGSEARA
jgi:N6-adenosine-specific RNA methylase IME4